MATEVEHLTAGVLIEPPASATRFAKLAEQHGWAVRITTSRGTPVDVDGNPVREITLEARSEEDGGGNRQVRGAAKVVDAVVVRCRRGADYLWAGWEDGKASSAHRMTGPLPGEGHTAAKAHLAVPLDRHRFVDTDRGDQVCLHHSERRARP